MKLLRATRQGGSRACRRASRQCRGLPERAGGSRVPARPSTTPPGGVPRLRQRRAVEQARVGIAYCDADLTGGTTGGEGNEGGNGESAAKAAVRAAGKTPGRLIVGISGASGMHLRRALARKCFSRPDIETHLVMSRSAEMTLSYETDLKPKDVQVRWPRSHPIGDIGAAISSGSFRTMGMVHRALLDPHHERDRDRRDPDAVVARRRRGAEGKAPAGAGDARNAAAWRASAHHVTLSESAPSSRPLCRPSTTRQRAVDDIVNHTCRPAPRSVRHRSRHVKRWKGGPGR